jgi:hypothetical protein
VAAVVCEQFALCSLRVAGSCGAVARARAVIRQDSGHGRWCWWSAGRGRVVGCRAGGLESLSVLSAS